MKPREEYDKDVADLEQIGRNLFARRNIWFYLFIYVYVVLRACVHSGGETRRKNKVQKSAAQTARSPTTNDDIIK